MRKQSMHKLGASWIRTRPAFTSIQLRAHASANCIAVSGAQNFGPISPDLATRLPSRMISVQPRNMSSGTASTATYTT